MTDQVLNTISHEGDSANVFKSDLLEIKKVCVENNPVTNDDRHKNCNDTNKLNINLQESPEVESCNGNELTEISQSEKCTDEIGNNNKKNSVGKNGCEKLNMEEEFNQLNDQNENSNETRNNDWLNILGHDKLRKKIVVKGKGYFTRPTKGQVVTIKSSGILSDGVKIDEREDFSFSVGDGDVIQALELCIPLMELGEKCILETNAQYAYGQRGREPDIPSNANITFDIELLKVEDPPLYHKMSLNERLQAGANKREIGNWWYLRDEYVCAITSYSRALTILNEGSTSNENEESIEKLKHDRVKCYNNLGACQMKIDAFQAAIKSCDSVLNLDPTNVKALFRKGKCLSKLGDLELAISALKKAIEIEPETKLLHTELSNLINKEKQQAKSARLMYQRMLGIDQTTVKDISTERNWKPWLLYGGAVTAVVASMIIMAYRNGHM